MPDHTADLPPRFVHRGFALLSARADAGTISDVGGALSCRRGKGLSATDHSKPGSHAIVICCTSPVGIAHNGAALFCAARGDGNGHVLGATRHLLLPSPTAGALSFASPAAVPSFRMALRAASCCSGLENVQTVARATPSSIPTLSPPPVKTPRRPKACGNRPGREGFVMQAV